MTQEYPEWVDSIRQAREKMEKDILSAIVQAQGEFVGATGLSVTDISVEMLRISEHGSRERFVPDAVKCTVELP